MEKSIKRNKSRQFWVEHVNAWSDSDLSQAEYCRQHNLPMGNFYNWKLKLKSRTVIPVVVQSDNKPASELSCLSAIEITLANNIRCQFPGNMDLNAASDWIRVLSNIQ